MNALKEKILQLIRAEGPIGIAQYMQIALMDPAHGYYVTRDPLARDFVTAPEVSQLFGEMIGLFLVQAWEDRGRPSRFHLVELGPGRGTLMADILRTAKIRPAFLEAAHVALIEMGPVLREVQAKTLSGARVQWVEGFEDIPSDEPLFVVANEFLDALPAHQFVKSAQGWHARMVTADGDDLCFALTPDAAPHDFAPLQFGPAPEGAVLEVGIEAIAATRTIMDRIAQSGGLALLIDYGHTHTDFGDTFQAMQANRFADPLAEPGEADLTFHVNFGAIASAAREQGARIFGPVTQKEFLEALGIRLRAEKLKAASPESGPEIDAALDRLTNPSQMGTLFKAVAFTDDATKQLPGFPC